MAKNVSIHAPGIPALIAGGRISLLDPRTEGVRVRSVEVTEPVDNIDRRRGTWIVEAEVTLTLSGRQLC